MILYLLVALGASLISSMVLTPWILSLCHKNGLYDTPNARKVHKSSIPRLGGVVFMPTTAVGLILSLILYTNSNHLPNTMQLSTLTIGGGMLIIYLVGLLDDLFGLPANLKFVVQLVAALAFPLCNLYINNLYGLFGIYELNPYVGYALTVFLVIFIANAINTIDGIDGLCSGLSVIALLVYTYFFLSIHNYIFCLFTSAMIGSIVVFMYYNLFGNPEKGTKTFMGDCGSLILGFSLSYLGLKLCSTNARIAPPEQGFLIPLSVLIIPALDLTRVALSRISKGIHPFHADKTHIHHLLLFNGLKQGTALWIILLADVMVVALNFALWNCDVQITWIFAIDICLYAVSVYSLLKCMPEHAVEQMNETQKKKTDEVLAPRLKTYVRPNLQDADVRVSIIVPTYNSSKTVADTLESILAQTYQNFEVVLCDGASQDNTIQIVEQYRDKLGDRLKAVSEPDKGIYDALNKGIERASGDIIGVLNSHDFYTSDDVLERIVDTFKHTPLLEAVYGDVHYVKPDHISHPIRYNSSRRFRPRNMRLGFMPAPSSFYCLKELYTTYGKYNLDYKDADFDQLFRLLFSRRVRALYVDMDFVTIRTNDECQGLSVHLQKLRDRAKSIRSYGHNVYYTLFAVRYIYKAIETVCERIQSLFR